MNINQLLIEELDESVSFEKLADNKYTFKIGDLKYNADFFPLNAKQSFKFSDALDIGFQTLYDGAIEFGFALVTKKGPTIEMTGTGHVKKIFSTIKEIVKEYTNIYKPSYFIINAELKNKSRISFYDLLYKNHERYLPNYKKVKMFEINDNKTYVLKRK